MTNTTYMSVEQLAELLGVNTISHLIATMAEDPLAPVGHGPHGSVFKVNEVDAWLDATKAEVDQAVIDAALNRLAQLLTDKITLQGFETAQDAQLSAALVNIHLNPAQERTADIEPEFDHDLINRMKPKTSPEDIADELFKANMRRHKQ